MAEKRMFQMNVWSWNCFIKRIGDLSELFDSVMCLSNKYYKSVAMKITMNVAAGTETSLENESLRNCDHFAFFGDACFNSTGKRASELNAENL